MTSRRTGSATVAVASATAPTLWSFCAVVVSGLHHRGDEQLGDVFDVDAGVEFGESSAIWRANSSSSAAPLPSCAATVDPADVPSNTSDVQQRFGSGRSLVGDAAQNTRLPRDARQPAACEHKCAFRHGSECARPSTCARIGRLNLSFVPSSTGR